MDHGFAYLIATCNGWTILTNCHCITEGVAIGHNNIVISFTRIFKYSKPFIPTLCNGIVLSLYKWGEKRK